MLILQVNGRLDQDASHYKMHKTNKLRQEHVKKLIQGFCWILALITC